MKKTFLTVLLFYIFTGIAVAQNLSKTTEYKILLTGASFASPQNGWFEIGCRKLNAEAINRAIGGEAIIIQQTEWPMVPSTLKKNWKILMH